MDRTLLNSVIILFLGLSVSPAQSVVPDEEVARKLINTQGCKACHSLGSDGGTLAISFEKIRTRLSRTEIRKQLVNPEQNHGEGNIPDFNHLSAAELDALVKFIQPDPEL